VAFFDIYRYLNAGTPMGRATMISATVSEQKRAEMAEWLREHGHAGGTGGERCWYCGERDAAEPVGVLVKKGLAVQHVVTMTVPVPACDACRAAFVGRARAAAMLHHAGFFAGLAGVIALLALFGQAPKEIRGIVLAVLIPLLVAAVIGASLGWVAVKARAGKTSRLRSELDHPLVEKVLADGWRPM
jgi:hypothetical protein